jgi:hypothetical protein
MDNNDKTPDVINITDLKQLSKEQLQLMIDLLQMLKDDLMKEAKAKPSKITRFLCEKFTFSSCCSGKTE